MLIALYGGVGSGKSYAASYLKREYHAHLLEADKIARELYIKNQPGYKAVIKICGRSILTFTGNIDRKILADVIYKDKKKCAKINRAIHPMVFKKCRDLTGKLYAEDSNALIVYEAALPSPHYASFDSVWYIKTDEHKALERVMQTRVYSEDKFRDIKANQPSDSYYEKLADVVIENNGSLAELEKKLDEAFEYSKRKLR